MFGRLCATREDKMNNSQSAACLYARLICTSITAGKPWLIGGNQRKLLIIGIE
jgi:hypothetical protein